MTRRFWNGPGDGEIMRQAFALKLTLCRDEEGEMSLDFEVRGCAGQSGFGEFAGLATDDDPVAFAKNLMAQFERRNPPGALL